MDNELFDALGGAELDAPGIDWNAFIARKRKKRRAIIFWWTFAGCAFLLISGYFACNFWDDKDKFVQIKEKHESPQSQLKDITEPASAGDAKHQAPDVPTKQNVKTGEGNISPSSEAAGKTMAKAESQTVQKGSHNAKAKGAQETRSLPNTTQPVADKEKESGTTLPQDIVASVAVLPSIEPGQDEQYRLGILPLTKRVFSFGKTNISKATNKVVRIDRSTVFVQFQAGPAFNFPAFSVSDAGRAFIHKDYKGIRSASETGLLGYGFQLAAGKTFRKLDIAFGLGVSSTRVFGHYDFTYSEKPILNPDGSVVGYDATSPSKVSFKSNQSYTFVEMPLYLDYQLFKRRQIKTSLHAGLLNQFLKQISGEQPNALFMNFKDVLSTENFRSYSANIELGCRVAYQYNPKTQLAITPVYRKNFGVQQAQSYYKSDFNAFVIQFSLRKYL